MATETDAYKVTVTNSQGNQIVAYVRPSSRQGYVRSMMEEYGNAKVEAITAADLPEGVTVS
jgi:hypothetical protein